LSHPFNSLGYPFKDLSLPFKEVLQPFNIFLNQLNAFGLPLKKKQSLFKCRNLLFIICLLSAYEPFNSKALVHVFAFPVFKIISRF